MERETAVIIGAGPAGLTAAYELLTRTNIKPIVYETESMTGGISKTIEYKGNRIDLGGTGSFPRVPGSGIGGSISFPWKQAPQTLLPRIPQRP